MRRIDKISKVLDVSLTRSCNYNCSWCNQRYDLTKPMHDMKESARHVVKNDLRAGAEWIKGLNANPYKDDYDKIIFSGGEPSLHPDFFDIVAKVNGYKCKIIVTNLSFDVCRLVEACRAAGTKVIVQPSFQFEFADFESFLKKMKMLDKNNMLSHFIPASIVDLSGRKEPSEYCAKFKKAGYDVSVYRFEGYHNGRFDYADVGGFGSRGHAQTIDCSSSSHYISPNGDVLFCATDTYFNNAKIYGNICDQTYEKIDLNRVCGRYGSCHVSSASWVRIRSLDKKKVVWKGKNYLERNMKNVARIYCEKKNYAWLSRVKKIYNNLSSAAESLKK